MHVAITCFIVLFSKLNRVNGVKTMTKIRHFAAGISTVRGTSQNQPKKSQQISVQTFPVHTDTVLFSGNTAVAKIDNWGLTAEDRAFQARAREYAQTIALPRAAKNDKEMQFDIRAIQELGSRGFLGVAVPKKNGGMGLGYLQTVLLLEQVAQADPSMAISLNAHNLAVSLMEKFCNDDQKKKFLKPLASGQGLAGFGMTEEKVGSDVANIETTAIREGKHFVINGGKRLITNANIAKTFVLLASTKPGEKARGITTFLVDANAPGFTRGEIKDKVGIRGADWGTLKFVDVRVPEENIIGSENEGFKNAMYALNCGRILVGAVCLGIAQGAFDRALAYARKRVQFEKPLIEHQAVLHQLARMEADITQCRQYVYHVAKLRDQGADFSHEAAIAKLQASEMATRVTQQAQLLLGGNGILKEFEVERFVRDALAMPIIEGATNIQLNIIGKGLQKRSQS